MDPLPPPPPPPADRLPRAAGRAPPLRPRDLPLAHVPPPTPTQRSRRLCRRWPLPDPNRWVGPCPCNVSTTRGAQCVHSTNRNPTRSPSRPNSRSIATPPTPMTPFPVWWLHFSDPAESWKPFPPSLWKTHQISLGRHRPPPSGVQEQPDRGSNRLLYCNLVVVPNSAPSLTHALLCVPEVNTIGFSQLAQSPIRLLMELR